MLFNFNKITPKKIMRWQKKNNTPKLINALSHDSYKIRKLSAYALGELKIKKAIPHLIKLLDDEFKEVMQASISALNKIGLNTQSKLAIEKCKKNWTIKATKKPDLFFNKTAIDNWEITNFRTLSRKTNQRILIPNKAPGHQH